MHREKVGELRLDGLTVNKWRFGTGKNAIRRDLNVLAKANWSPDKVYVECFSTFWWEGAQEFISVVRQVFPQCHVVLIGTYASLAPRHARSNTLADEVVTEPLDNSGCLPADFSLYPVPPAFSYLTLNGGSRSGEEVVEEIRAAKDLGIKRFVFAEDSIASHHLDLYMSVLERIVAANLKVKFYALGNIAPSDLVVQRDLALLMKRAGYAQIWLSDDRHSPVTSLPDEQLIENYRAVAELCRDAGFKRRANEVIAAVCIGRQGESLSERVRMAAYAAHHIGSVIFWAYQPRQDECDDMPLEAQNGKLYPLRHKNGHAYRDYLNVMGLAAVLNAKHRTNTFDFMGEGLISNLFRNSLERHAWEAADEIKGSIQLPMRVDK